MFDKIHAARLTALVDHLETAETLKVGRFNFSHYLAPDTYDPCHTMGCAIGEASLLWPGAFIGSAYGYCAIDFFGLAQEEYQHLFTPSFGRLISQDTGRFGGTVLGGDATRYEVAAQIRAFLEVKASEAAEETLPEARQ